MVHIIIDKMLTGAGLHACYDQAYYAMIQYNLILTNFAVVIF